ncbi:MAG: hypothetical protein WC959_00480 [Kiritimatiellales bacterium]
MKNSIIRLVTGLIGFAGMVSANFIVMDSKTFSYTENFNSLGSGDVTWNDGNTIKGVYMMSTTNNSLSAANWIPTTVAASDGNKSGGGPFNMGEAGSSDRALGWFTSSGFKESYTGIRFQNKTGETNNITLQYSVVLEQWGTRNKVDDQFILQYKIHSSNGDVNNLMSANWITLGTAITPIHNNSEGTDPNYVNGNTNQFTISGAFDVELRNNQFITFRLVDKHDANNQNSMTGIDSFTLTIIPEASSLHLFLISSAGFFVVRQRLRNRE